MDTRGLEAVLFDAGNTLVYVDPGRMREIFRAEGVVVDADAFRRAELEARRDLHRNIDGDGAGTEAQVWGSYFSTLFRASGVPADALPAVAERVREEHARDHLWTHALDGTRETLRALLDAGYRLGVISNADGRVEGLLERTGLRDCFELVLDSAVVGVEKPDPAIFLEACRRLDLRPETCLYVGDLYPVDYVGATGAGLRAVLVDPLGFYDGRASRVAGLGDLPELLGGRHPFPRSPAWP